MGGGVYKPRARVSLLGLSKASQEKRPLRRSARLQGQQPRSSVSSIRPLRARTLTSERPGLTRNTQLEAKDEEPKATKTVQQPKPPRRSSSSSITPPEVKVEEQGRISQITPLRKRQINNNNNDDKHQLKPTQLTRKNLAKFNKMMKEEGTGSKDSISTPPESISESTFSKTLSTTMSGFAIQANRNGILRAVQSHSPANLEDIRKRYAQSRSTALPTESTYGDYVRTVENAVNEITITMEVARQLLKNCIECDYSGVFNQSFTGFPKDVGFNNGLSALRPDYVEGPLIENHHPFPVHEYVNGAALYKDNPCSVILPHIAGECKGRGKDMDQARLQSAYVGAALVYVRNQALSYLGKQDPPGHAEVTTFTTDGTNLNLFAHYATQSENGTLQYHQYLVKSTNLIESPQALKDGRRGLRNAQDYAKKQSYALRDELKEHWQKHRSVPRPAAKGAPLPVADGTFGERDTDEPGYVVVEQPCQPTPAELSSVSSSKSVLPVDDHVSCSSGQKRKATPSRRPSHDSAILRTKFQRYWKLDENSGKHYHSRSNGEVIWLEDSDNEN
ncbi:hypothetical protein F4810DRAFT_716746 [Camillea tinctor]|nr:hypothetical protein F4810DRAFT_716746 [Camillea tinctor]